MAMKPGLGPGLERVRIWRHGRPESEPPPIGDPGSGPSEDTVAVEEPLEIRVAGETLAVTMRTPGHDAELVIGFLLAEGIIESVDQVGGVAHCGKPGSSGNVIEVTAAPGSVIAWDSEGPARRATLVSSACGVCGRRSVEELLSRAGVVNDEARFEVPWIEHLTASLAPFQSNFSRSGGVHAAAVFEGGGGLEVLREDVGRHNAVDKVVGRLALDGKLPAANRALVVSGRASFEIVQKAAVAKIALLVSVSAPSSLAIQAAAQAGITLVGFARGPRFNVYAGAGRVIGASPEAARA